MGVEIHPFFVKMIILKKILKKIHFECSDDKELIFVRKILTFKDENAYFSGQYKSGKWDGKIRLYSEAKNTFDFGLLSYVFNKIYEFGKYQCEIFWDDDEIKYEVNITNDYPRHYQKAAVKALFDNKNGIIKVPTRGGKTVIASECIYQAFQNGIQNVLFVVDSVDLLNQSKDEIAKYLNIPTQEIGIIWNKHFTLNKITVATIQTIQSVFSNKQFRGKVEDIEKKRKIKRQKQNQLREYLNNLEFLIVDEVHEFTSEDRTSFIKKCYNTKVGLFLSATPYKSDFINNMRLEGVTGGIIYEISENQLIEEGVLAENKVLLLTMEHNLHYTPSEEGDSMVKYREFVKEAILENDNRDKILLSLISICKKLSLKTLLLFVNKEYGNKISKLSGEVFISGDDNIFERKIQKDEFLKGEGKILLASNIYKKGITLPAVKVMVNCNGGKEQTLIIQKKGRVLGTTEDKTKAIIIDIIDIEDEYLSSHSMERIAVYEESVGKEKIDVISTSDNEFESLVTENLKNWFNI